MPNTLTNPNQDQSGNPDAGSPNAGNDGLPQDAEQRVRHFQSKYDQSQAQNAKLQGEIDRLNAVKPIADYIDADPRRIERFSQILNEEQGGSTGTPSQGQPAGNSAPQAPSAPEVNMEELDPATRYLFQSNQALSQQMNQLLGHVSAQSQAQAKAAQEQTQRAQEKAYRDRVARELRTQHGFDDEQVERYMAFTNSPDSLQTSNLVKYFQVIDQSGKAVDGEADADAQRREQNLNIPNSVATAQGANQVKAGSEDEKALSGFYSSIGVPSQ